MGGKTSLELVGGRYGTVLDSGGNGNGTYTISITFFFPMMIIYLLVSNPLL